MRPSAAKSFVIDALSDRSLDKIGSRQKNGAGFVNNHCFVGHDRKICATSNTASHNSSDLDDAHRRHARIVSELPSEMLLIRKYFVLHRKEYARAVYEVDHRETIFKSDFLSAKIFLCCYWKPGSGFYCRIVGNNHHHPPMHIPKARHHSSSRTTALLLVHPFARKKCYLKKIRTFINEVIDAFARCQFSFLMLLIDLLFSAPKFCLLNLMLKLKKKLLVLVFILVKVQFLFHLRSAPRR